MKEFIEYIIKHLIENPESLSIETVENDDKLVFQIRAKESDLGQIIGRRGRTVLAIRILVNALAARKGKRAIIEIME
jgi:predicted RNA-binding protein YlqC (UPF0109 family)